MLLWDGGAWTLVPMLRSFWRSEPRAFLVNRASGNSLSSLGGETWGRFGSVRITRRELPQHAPWELREAKWGGAENWYDGATLAVLTHEWEERFVKEVRVEQFELAPPPNAGGGR